MKSQPPAGLSGPVELECPPPGLTPKPKQAVFRGRNREGADQEAIRTDLIPVFGIPYSELERVKGIEPSSSAWKAVALPLSYTRLRSCSRRLSALPQPFFRELITRA